MTHTTIAEHHATPTWEGITTLKFAWWLFLASEVMFFAGLIAAYIVLRAGSPTWPIVQEELSVGLVASANGSWLLGDAHSRAGDDREDENLAGRNGPPSTPDQQNPPNVPRITCKAAPRNRR